MTSLIVRRRSRYSVKWLMPVYMPVRVISLAGQKRSPFRHGRVVCLGDPTHLTRVAVPLMVDNHERSERCTADKPQASGEQEPAVGA